MSSINSLNIQSHSSIKYKNDELNSITKLRLEALGIDPKSVKTEAQAQLIIAQSEGAQKHNDIGNKQQGGTQQELISDAKKLAEHVGVCVSEKDLLEDILQKISETLQTMANDPEKANFVREAQEKLVSIAQRADIMVNVQQNIFNEMNMISISNRLIHGL